jgi:hypothetical protein
MRFMFVRVEVLTAVIVKISVFWDVTLRSLIGRYKRS